MQKLRLPECPVKSNKMSYPRSVTVDPHAAIRIKWLCVFLFRKISEIRY